MKRKFKIAFFGSSLLSAYWNGAATYYRGIIKELFKLGYDITFYEPDAYERQAHRDIDNPDYAHSVVYQSNNLLGLINELDNAKKADIIIKASGVGVFDKFLESEVLNFKSYGKRVIFWDVDAPATLERVENDEDYFRELIPQYDLIFTYGGGSPVVEKYLKLDAQACIPIYNAHDPETHFQVPPDNRFNGLLGFLGNRMQDREERVHEFFFKPASIMKDKTFILGGNGWDNNVPKFNNLKNIGHVYTEDHNAFNCSQLAVLNISRSSMARFGFSPATRVFEAAGAGACIITDKWKGIDFFLEPGEEILVASTGEDVVNILNNLTQDRAKEIGRNAMRKVLSEHTYQHRAKEVDNILTALFE